eukprot:364685-Chlamydomonas_euryale.AAC.18
MHAAQCRHVQLCLPSPTWNCDSGFRTRMRTGSVLKWPGAAASCYSCSCHLVGCVFNAVHARGPEMLHTKPYTASTADGAAFLATSDVP